ncbi:oleate hydratase [Methyloglobulus sp.]|uniref:oleate hydratase n=1 Tax=Methyloglobulus sp. TaxID=2518622 RepID=UPI0032B70979
MKKIAWIYCQWLPTLKDSLDTKRIEDWFSPMFFENNFWLMWSTMFAFQPWHSVVELKRYLLRFIQLFPDFNKMGGGWRTPYNQYDSMIPPLTIWLKAQGVQFSLNTEVTGLDFDLGGGERSVQNIRCTNDSNLIISKALDYQERLKFLTSCHNSIANSSTGCRSVSRRHHNT